MRSATPLRAVLTCACVLIGVTSCSAGEAREGSGPASEITVAAASYLRFAFEELGRSFEEETGTSVSFAFGSSGQLREQIVNGAPFDLFASADAEQVDAVIEAGHAEAGTRSVYGTGRIVLWTPPGAELPRSLVELTDPRYRRIAMANPRHAPYGLAAEQALLSAGILETLAPRLIYGENVADTLRIAESGNADVALVALSLALAGGGEHLLLPAELHDPLHHTLVVTSTGVRGEAARAFAAHLTGPVGQEVLARHGLGAEEER